jgi:sugar porter (SP) family MFS transporter
VSAAKTDTAGKQTQDEDIASSKLTGKLIVAAAVSAISALLYGYDTGIISGALLQIRKDFHTTSSVEQVIAGSILLGAVIGALTCSQLSERRGRRGTVLLLAGVFVLGAVLCSLAPNAWLLSAARIILGFAVGGATQTVPMYVAELAPPARRGQLVLTFQVGIGVGIVVSTIVGATESFTWRISVAMAAVPAAIMFVMLLRLPESPRWLVKVDRDDDARDVLGIIRPPDSDLDAELGSIHQIEEAEQSGRREDRGFAGLKKAWVRPALLVGCGIAIFTQLSGIEMIIYYAPTILTDNGFSKHDALLVSVGLGATYLVMMIVGLSIVDHVGRRRLTMIMVPGAAIALFVLGALFISGHHDRSDIPFVIVCLIVFMFFNAGGLQLMGWLTGSEIYPLAVRSAGTSVQAATLWATNLLITLTLLTIINAVGAGPTMWLYGLFNVAAFVFVWRRMPELTGRSLEQIEGTLRDGDFKPKDFAAATS